MHSRSVAAAAIDGVTGELFQSKLTPAHDHIRSWIEDLPGPVAVTYEAGPTGFGLSRALNTAGIRCVVAAPSKLQRPSGDRVKTPAKEAIHLARLLRLDEVTAVVVPSLDQEAARDLVRAREDCHGDLMRARHRLSKLLLRHGLAGPGPVPLRRGPPRRRRHPPRPGVGGAHGGGDLGEGDLGEGAGRVPRRSGRGARRLLQARPAGTGLAGHRGVVDRGDRRSDSPGCGRTAGGTRGPGAYPRPLTADAGPAAPRPTPPAAWRLRGC